MFRRMILEMLCGKAGNAGILSAMSAKREKAFEFNKLNLILNAFPSLQATVAGRMPALPAFLKNEKIR